MNPLPDDRSLLARATEWSFAVMSIAAEMVLPILGGHWLDQRLGIPGVFALLGGILGVSAGIWSLLRIVEPLRHPNDPRDNPPPKSP
ncbi:MAG: AtpZ/AtpI family protein [Thermoguttaceae bacterium]